MMRLLFRDPLFDALLLRTMGHCCYGGADVAECLTTARGIREKDCLGWFRAWMELADRLQAEAEESLRRGHTISARDAFLRASNYYRNAYVFVFQAPPSGDLQRAYDLHRSSFRRAAALMDPSVEKVAIPYQQTLLHGYFLRAAAGGEPSPTLILNGGYDSTAEECYFWNAVAALRRGYHCLIFDGPGQGATLLEDRLPFRPDWEAVIGPVVDWLAGQQCVDPRRIGIIGLSFGGYLALRAASGEPRLAACVADPGEFSLLEIFQARIPRFLAKDLPALRGLGGALLRRILSSQLRKPTAGWALRRGLFVHGAPDLEDYLRQAAAYTLAGREGEIRCPTLICHAEDDDIGVSARRVYDVLTCEKEFLAFRRSEGAAEHCEAGARSLFHERAFNWLRRWM
ncbi:MAG: alpha/beta fold hydrolase [Bryobacteraceae bacterium]